MESGQKTKTAYTATLYLFLIILIFISLIFHIFSLPYDQLPGFFKLLVKISYQPHFNLIEAGKIADINPYVLYYIFVSLSLTVLFILNKLLASLKVPFLPPLKVRAVFMLCIGTLFLFITAVQTIRIKSFDTDNLEPLAGKTPGEKYALLFNGMYYFSQFCKEVIPPDQAAKFMTDMDTARDPGMFTNRVISFLLYPVDLRKVRGQTPAYIIMYKKRQAADHVPEGYSVVGQFDSTSLVAVRVSDK